MATKTKLDSNQTGLRIAEEASLKTLPGTPIWQPYEPNEYSDFGGDYKTAPRMPINRDRQRRKGPIVDLDGKAGFSTDLTQSNLQDLLQGYFFASFRRKGEEAVTAVDIDAGNPDEYEVASTTGFYVGSLIKGSGFTNAANNALNVVTAIVSDTSVEVATGQLTAEASPPSAAKITVVGYQFGSGEASVTVTGVTLPRITRASGSKDFTEFGLVPGEWIFIGGDDSAHKFATAACNGYARVRSVAATYIELDKTAGTMVDDNGSSKTIRLFFGRVLKNETGSNIVTRTYQLERTLGEPDTASPSASQAEYITGAFASEFVLNLPEADKITCDLSFMGAGYETVDSATGVKSGTRPDLVADDAFNTSNDLSRVKFAACSSSNANVTPFFTYVSEMTLTITNNIALNKALGTLGAIDGTAGFFDVKAEVTAYFATTAVLAARSGNTDCTLDVHLSRDNAGVSIDLPLLGLSGGIPEVKGNEPIKIPLTADAASAVDVNANLNHTLLMVFFDYLPSAADV